MTLGILFEIDTIIYNYYSDGFTIPQYNMFNNLLQC